MTLPVIDTIVTVTLNPTIDRIIEVPGLHVGGHLPGRLRSRLPAGKAVNASRALSTLGVASTAAGWVGQETADLFEQALHYLLNNRLYVFLPYERHLKVNLGKLRLAVGTKVFVTEAFYNLEVTVKPRNHEDLLEELR